MSLVFPGVADVLAKLPFMHNMLISDDLPTFDRPMKAYSGISGFGHSFSDGLLFTNSDLKRVKD